MIDLPIKILLLIVVFGLISLAVISYKNCSKDTKKENFRNQMMISTDIVEQPREIDIQLLVNNERRKRSKVNDKLCKMLCEESNNPEMCINNCKWK